ncbi:MAG TPA: flagellar biosynthetic protein FliO [Macromonas sp.]|nr:flagellar biosynthetic protein FliO [Macromonas sp.]
MSDHFFAFAPALGLLLLLVLLAWGVQWAKRRAGLQNGQPGTGLRLLAHLNLGPQQRVVVVEVSGPQGPVQLTLGVTPQHVRTLHTQALSAQRGASQPPAAATPTPSYKDVAAALQQRPGEPS